MSKHGTVHWSELMTHDLDAAKAYYVNVCGWQITEMPMPDGSTYYLGMKGEVPMAGMMQMNGPEFEGIPSHWLTYLAVDDVDATVKQTKDAGGDVLQDSFDVSGVGRIAILKDPTGAAIGFMTPADNS